MNPLHQLSHFGQSVWLDFIKRDLLKKNAIRELILEDDLRGMTSNPSIFEKAIASSHDYEEDIKLLLQNHIFDTKDIYEALAVQDIQDAADALFGVYEKTQHIDGYVSLEVSPLLAHDTQGTIDEAERLYRAVNRKNVMIKVPGTKEGMPAIRHLIRAGISVNVTLLFSQHAYQEAADAYLQGLEDRVSDGNSLEDVASVASFFISRIDSAVDKLLEGKSENLQGKIAIANAKLAYQHFLRLYESERFKKLQENGAQKQRLLWASTSTKNAQYKDVLYVEELIGKDTVNTIPPATFDAFRDHGLVAETLTQDVAGAKKYMDELECLGIHFETVTNTLLDEGVKLFEDSFRQLLEAIELKKKLFVN